MAYQLDNCCTLLGITIENALQERKNIGTEKELKYEQRYTLSELLRDDFRLPAPAKPSGEDGLRGLMGLPGVKTIHIKK